MIDDKFQSTLSVRRATTTLAVDAAPVQFQSTLSVRRATVTPPAGLQCMEFQSTLSVRRATFVGGVDSKHDTISIHALRKESDPSSA